MTPFFIKMERNYGVKKIFKLYLWLDSLYYIADVLLCASEFLMSPAKAEERCSVLTDLPGYGKSLRYEAGSARGVFQGSLHAGMAKQQTLPLSRWSTVNILDLWHCAILKQIKPSNKKQSSFAIWPFVSLCYSSETSNVWLLNTAQPHAPGAHGAAHLD